MLALTLHNLCVLSCLCAGGGFGEGDKRTLDTAGNRNEGEFGQAVEQPCSCSQGTQPESRITSFLFLGSPVGNGLHKNGLEYVAR